MEVRNNQNTAPTSSYPTEENPPVSDKLPPKGGGTSQDVTLDDRDLPESDGKQNRRASGFDSLPVLEAPLGDSVSSMQVSLGAIFNEMIDKGLTANKSRIDSVSKERQAKIQEQMDKLKEAVAKAAQAKKSGLFGKIFGWIGTIATVISAVVLMPPLKRIRVIPFKGKQGQKKSCCLNGTMSMFSLRKRKKRSLRR
jgi:Secretion system effector C (SseC) like family